MKVSVDAEIDLEYDVDAGDLAEALIAKVGKVRALRMIESSTKGDGRARFTVLDPDDEADDLRRRIRDGLALIERGKTEEGMYHIRMVAAEETHLLEWQAVKEGKHPFLILRESDTQDEENSAGEASKARVP
jgi:hypothetical protein